MSTLQRPPAAKPRGMVILAALFGLIFSAFIACFSLFIPDYRKAGCLVQIFFGVGGVVGFLAAAFTLAAGAGYLNTQNDDWIIWGCCAGIPLGAIVGAEFATWLQALFVRSLE